MTIDEIKELIHVVRETGIFELEVQRGDDKVRIRTSSTPGNQELVLPTAVPFLSEYRPQTQYPYRTRHQRRVSLRRVPLPRLHLKKTTGTLL
jgi:hypothetical protein